MLAPRLQRLPRHRVCGREVAVAVDFRSRLLGLAQLEPRQAGSGLLIPRCASVHTFGMRFDLDLVFLDLVRQPLAIRRDVPPGRLAWHSLADSVLELPAGLGGEFESRWP